MFDNDSSSYESIIKRLQKIYQKSQDTKNGISSSQPDNSKSFLTPNWLQNIAIVDDTRDADTGIDDNAEVTAVTTSVQDIATYLASFIPVTSNITDGAMPLQVNYAYSKILPNITKEIIPFLEYQTSFASPDILNNPLLGGFLWNVDVWVDDYVVMANGVTVWDGIDPPVTNNVEISQYQVDNNYTNDYIQSWGLVFTSTIGGEFGHGASVGVLILSIYDSATSSYVPQSEYTNGMTFLSTYTIYMWSNSFGFAFTAVPSDFTTYTVTQHVGAYIALWPGSYNPFYIFTVETSGGGYTLGELILFPPTDYGHILSPITFTINADGPTKYSDIVMTDNALATYVNASPSYDPFYVRQSLSTDLDEVWQVNLSFGGVSTAPGVATSGEDLPQYNDTYTWSEVTAPGWSATYDHSIIEGDQFSPAIPDMTARVVVAVRPPINWKNTIKF